MADQDEFKIQISATGGEEAASQLRAVGAEAKQASELAVTGNMAATASTDQATTSLRDLSIGLKSGRALSGSLAAIMSGDLSTGIKGAAIGMRGLNMAMRANPVGLVLAGFTALLALWAKFHKSADDSAAAVAKVDDKTGDVTASAGKMGAAGEAAGEQIKSGMMAAATGSEGLITKLDAALTAAKRLRSQMDEMLDVGTAAGIANIDLDEANNKLSPEEAAKQRTKLRADSERTKLAGEKEDAENERQQASDALTQHLQARAQLEGDYEAASQAVAAAQKAVHDYWGTNAQVNARLQAKLEAAQEALQNTPDPFFTEKDDNKTGEDLRKRVDDADHKLRKISIQERTVGIKEEAENTKTETAAEKKAREEAEKAMHGAHQETLRGIENDVKAAEQAAADAVKDSEDYREKLKYAAGLKKKLADAKGAAEEEEGKATPESQRGKEIEKQGVDQSTNRAVRDSAEREQKRLDEEKKKRDKAAAEQAAFDEEMVHGFIPRRRPGDRIDGHAYPAHPRSGLDRPGEETESNDDFHDRFKPKLDFRAQSADAGTHPDAQAMSTAAAKMEEASPHLKDVATSLTAMTTQVVGLAAAAAATAGAVPGIQSQIAQIWSALDDTRRNPSAAA